MMMYNPPHPGGILEACFAPNFTLGEAATQLNLPVTLLQDLIQGKADFTRERAYLISLLLDDRPALWLGMQADHDCWQVTFNHAWRAEILAAHQSCDPAADAALQAQLSTAHYLWNPPHPGAVLSALLRPSYSKAKDLALRLGLPSRKLKAVLKGKKPVTPKLALLFSQRVPYLPPEYWLKLKCDYDRHQVDEHMRFTPSARPQPEGLPGTKPMRPSALLAQSSDQPHAQAAALMGIDESELCALLEERNPISKEMAVLLPRLVPTIPAVTWIRLQHSWDLWQIAHDDKWRAEIDAAHPGLAEFGRQRKQERLAHCDEETWDLMRRKS